ncbi:Site-specific recombinase XerD [Chitinophaga eiseniae]|uniref:Site-specific recombinase XerD n=1 Tax=Chitinophaga eiseniae TaxID=634771 RepID=A0A1T4U2F3_9BACT|nr:site-specific integrase [Chitinophaga eiseniae]SKA46729.1 Site-specific recombinase XerD [Chitinophaga eiseniae]
MNLLKRKNAKGDKTYYYYDFGRGKGQRPATGIFVYTKPKDQTQKNHNKQALALLEVKKSQAIIEQLSIGTAYIPPHKFKDNFLDYYEEYVNTHRRDGNRHLQNSLNQFRLFLDTKFISPMDITEVLCKNFRRYLLDKYTGETPSDYYTRFKWVLAAATSDGYFRVNPTEKVTAKSNPSVRLKEHLEVSEYLELLNTPCTNEEVKDAFIFCCYTGLRWVDVKQLRIEQINGPTLRTRIIQAKTGLPVTLTLHPIAHIIVNKRRESATGLLFRLPTADGANKVLAKWFSATKIDKYITWSCARLSFAILLKDKLVDDPTIAYLMGHSTTKQIQKTYKRHRPADQQTTIGQLPTPELLPYFLNI